MGYLPDARQADMHGLVRVVVTAESRHKARQRMRAAGVMRVAFLEATKSAVEQQAALFRKDIDGPVLIAPLPLAYLKAGYYEELGPGAQLAKAIRRHQRARRTRPVPVGVRGRR